MMQSDFIADTGIANTVIDIKDMVISITAVTAINKNLYRLVV